MLARIEKVRARFDETGYVLEAAFVIAIRFARKRLAVPEVLLHKPR